jgi:hypothetical protein
MQECKIQNAGLRKLYPFAISLFRYFAISLFYNARRKTTRIGRKESDSIVAYIANNIGRGAGEKGDADAG